MNAPDWLESRTILLTEAGGVFIAPASCYHGFLNKSNQAEILGGDWVYEVRYFFELANTGSAVARDILLAATVKTTFLGALLTTNADAILADELSPQELDSLCQRMIELSLDT